MTQIAFDIDELIHEVEVANAPTWAGAAPLHFTTNFHTPDELDEAFDRWVFEHGHLGSHPASHMWIPEITTSFYTPTTREGHSFALYTADTRCNCSIRSGLNCQDWEDSGKCQCIGDLLYQTICTNCQWHTISNRENETVLAWHDHAWAGWRNLPIVPASVQHSKQAGRYGKKFYEWISTNYPTEWQIKGAPIITERVPGRCVPGGSPWGGYDLRLPD